MKTTLCKQIIQITKNKRLTTDCRGDYEHILLIKKYFHD